MKRKTRVAICIFMIIASFLFSGCSAVKRLTSKTGNTAEHVLQDMAMKRYKKQIEKDLGGITLPDNIEIEEKDDFIPFISDGYQKMTVRLPQDYDLTPYIDDTWIAYPLSDSATKIIFGYEQTQTDPENGKTVTSIAESFVDNYIPEDIENGYYILEDLAGDLTGKDAEDSILSRKSQEYRVMVYDADKGIVYMYYLAW